MSTYGPKVLIYIDRGNTKNITKLKNLQMHE